MPDIWTHILCGNDALDTLENNNFKLIIQEKIQLFNLGCQGPDIFLYNDFLPWIKEKRGPKYGELLHNKNTGMFLTEAFKYLKQIKNKNSFKQLFVYLAGYLSHYVLDSNAHPFIYYYTGKFDKKEPNTIKYDKFHKRLEQMIDIILLKEKRKLDAYKCKVYNQIDVGYKLPDAIIKFYKHVFSKVYNVNTKSDFINDSYRDIKNVQKIMYDSTRIKKTLLKSIDILNRGKTFYNYYVYPKKIDNKFDYLNRNHDIWNHPCDKMEVYSHSFDDIYNKSVKETNILINKAIKFLNSEMNTEDLQQAFGNKSYISGKDSDINCCFKYFNPIFEEKFCAKNVN